ncbi:SipW-dependent-type signal peptide-containing protein [uncultured Allofournierella sp.]|uniref:SipW-dependent-type signal peptide-containing protein n=1 Tax=uncultured Allofournierella sp. TaxID=1940258 RepID=UPI0025D44076|nr:SipW-dependent-type signal peptide-containing protein [uncultured Fournierella sp.]
MKMKNMLIGGMSLALVACLSVGATLAYFTASDKEVVNTFNFVADGDGDGKYISVTLKENDPTEALKGDKYGDAKAEQNTQKGYDYTDVVPGQALPKEPVVTVKTDVPAYIYLRVTDKDADTGKGVEAIINTAAPESNWKLVEGTQATDPENNEQTAVYVYKTTVNKEFSGALAALFTEVKVPNVAESEVKDFGLNDVKIEVAAIQSAGFTSAEDAYSKGDVANLFTSVQ